MSKRVEIEINIRIIVQPDECDAVQVSQGTVQEQIEVSCQWCGFRRLARDKRHAANIMRGRKGQCPGPPPVSDEIAAMFEPECFG